MTDTNLSLSLDIPSTVTEVEKDIVIMTEEEKMLSEKAKGFADQLLSMSDENAAVNAIDEMGRELQVQSATKSKMLTQPIKSLAQNSEDGGSVAKALVDLKMNVESLDPNKYDFSAGWMSRFAGYIPGVGNAMKRYFTKFESAQTVIDAVVNSLENGRDELKRDNITLANDQNVMRDLTKALMQQIKLAEMLDQEFQNRLEAEADEEKRRFIEEQLLFPLRQRIMDLQQQLAVNQQGIVAFRIVMENNKELVRGVNRAIDVTVSALQVAVTIALALNNQKIVLDKIKALNETTSNLISGTAKRLRTQGTEIHKQASSAMLDMSALESAFADITGAIDEISRYRREALPQMAENIVRFDELSKKGEEMIDRFERGDKVQSNMNV